MKTKIIAFTLGLGLTLGSLGASVSAEASSNLENYLFQSKIKTDAILVIKNGQTLLERYGPGFDSEKKHILWSTSKSITSLFIGKAISENKLTLDDAVETYFPVVNNSELKVHHLLEWASGFKWIEEYNSDAASVAASGVIQMLYGPGSKDMSGFVASRGFEHKPGEFWRYSTGDSTLLMGVLGKVYTNQDYLTLPHKIFDPLHITNFTWERDQTGNLMGGSSLYLTAPGLARIGEMILNNGSYLGQTVVSPEWLHFLFTSPKIQTLDQMKSDDIAGRQWWINSAEGSGELRSWPNAPPDTIAAEGHYGQYLIVIPSLNTVAVRFGNDTETDKTIDPLTLNDVMTYLVELVR